MCVHSRHRRTLATLFAVPTPAAVLYEDAMALLRALGASVDEGRRGSRVAVTLRGAVASLHRPHPAKELKRYQVRDLRDFLAGLGVMPDTEV